MLLAVALLTVGLTALIPARPASAAPCDAPVVSPVACENTKPGNPESEWGISGAGSASIQGFATEISVNAGGDRSGSRSTPTRRRTASTSTGWATTPGWGPGGSPRSTPTVLNNQPNCLTASSHRARRLRQLDAQRLLAGADRRRVGDLLRQTGPHRRHGRGEPRLLRGAQRQLGNSDSCSSRPRTPPGRPTTSTAATACTTGSPAGRAYKVSYNRPFTTRDTGQRGLRLQRRVPDGPLAGVERLRRQLQLGRRHRPPRRGAAGAQDVHVGRTRRVLVGRAAHERRGRPRRPGSIWPSSAATRSSGRPAGRTASTAPTRRTGRWSATRRPTPTARSTRRRRPGPGPGAIPGSAHRRTAADPRTR